MSMHKGSGDDRVVLPPIHFPTRGRLGPVGLVSLLALVLLVVILMFMSGAVVNAGYVGVVTTFGKVEEGVMYPGFHLIVPVAQKINQIDTRVQPHPFKSIDAASLEMQSVKLTGMMNYHLEPSRAGELFQNVGLDFASKVIDPAFNDFIKEVVPKYNVTSILARREDIRSQAKEKLAGNLAQYGIVVDDIYISDIAFSAEYQATIEKKQSAQQGVETETQILAQKQIQAQQKVVEAKAEGDAQVARAEGEAKANDERSKSITPQLIEYLRWTKWDGKLPMVTNGGNTLFDITPLAPPASQPAQGSQDKRQ